MVEEMYNASLYGRSIEGFMNYINVSVSGWFVTLFLVFIWIVTLFVLSKGEWKMSNNLGFAFFITLILSMIFSLFTIVNTYIIFISVIGLGISIAWSIWEAK